MKKKLIVLLALLLLLPAGAARGDQPADETLAAYFKEMAMRWKECGEEELADHSVMYIDQDFWAENTPRPPYYTFVHNENKNTVLSSCDIIEEQGNGYKFFLTPFIIPDEVASRANMDRGEKFAAYEEYVSAHYPFLTALPQGAVRYLFLDNAPLPEKENDSGPALHGFYYFPHGSGHELAGNMVLLEFRPYANVMSAVTVIPLQ